MAPCPSCRSLCPSPASPHPPGPHLHQLHEVLEVHLLVDAELAGGVDDAVVLHLALAADAQRVVPGVVGALPHQEQPGLGGVQQPLRLLPRDLPVEPPVGHRVRAGCTPEGLRLDVEQLLSLSPHPGCPQPRRDTAPPSHPAPSSQLRAGIQPLHTLPAGSSRTLGVTGSSGMQQELQTHPSCTDPIPTFPSPPSSFYSPSLG